MRFDKLDLNLLVALDALISERSVTGASKQLCLSQPAVTSSLNRLREYFEDDLLVLEGRQMRLTYRAEQLAEPVKQTLALIRSEITQPREFNPATSNRKFVIISSDYMQTVLLADVISEVAREAPKVIVEVVRPSSDSEERFERSEIDISITVKHFLLEKHPAASLFKDEHVLVTWNESKYGNIITRDQFLEAGHVAATFGRDRRPALSEISLQDLREQRRVELLVPSFSALAQSVVGTDRIALMHRKLAEHFRPLYAIRLHPVPMPIAPIEEVLQWHRLRTRDAGLQWLKNLIIARSEATFNQRIDRSNE